MIMRFRKWLAGKVLGEQIAMFLPSGFAEVMETGRYEDLPDDSLAAATRYWFYAINKVTAEQAERRHAPLKVYTVSNAVMTLIRHVRERNGDTLTITQTGDISGEDVGTWQLVLTKLEGGYQFEEPGHREQEWDGEKLVKDSYSFKLGA